MKPPTTDLSVDELTLSCIIKGVAGLGLRKALGSDMVSDALLAESAADGVAVTALAIKSKIEKGRKELTPNMGFGVIGRYSGMLDYPVLCALEHIGCSKMK